jgi:hypothetical protein
MAEHESGGEGGVLRELLAVFGFGVEEKELEKGKNKLDEFLDKVKEVGEALLAAFAVDEIYEFAEAQAQAMSAIEHTASQLGITTERVQELRFAAKAAGEDADALLRGMSRLQVTQQAAAQGSEEAAKGFRAVGLSASELKGIGADEMILRVADGLEKIKDPSKRAAAATALFGRQGRELIPVLGEGREGLEGYIKLYHDLGGGYDEAAFKAGKAFETQSARTNLVLTALKNTIAKALLPVVTAFSHGVERVVKWFNDMAKSSHIVEAALVALGAAGAAFAIEMAIAEAPLLAMTALIAGLVLAIDDLYTFLTGGESEIGDVIDKIFGKDAQVDALNQIRDGWRSITETFRELWPYVTKVVDAFKWIVDKAGALGDAMAKLDIAIFERTGVRTHAINPASGSGLSYEQNVAARQAELMLAAQAKGQEFHPTEIPASFKGYEAAFMQDIKLWADKIRSGAYLESGFFGPMNQWNAPTASVSVSVNVPPGLNEKQVGEHVAKQVGEVMKQRLRDAAARNTHAGT